MASATIEKVVTVTLVLTKKEALILKQLVQNPIHGELPEEEMLETKEWRESLWNALPSQSELY